MTRYFFDEYYMSLVEFKDFIILINSKPFFDQPVKNKTRSIWKIIEISRNGDYTAGNLIKYLYYQNFYKLIGIDLLTQKNMSIPQEIHVTRNLEEDDGAIMFFLLLASSKKLS